LLGSVRFGHYHPAPSWPRSASEWIARLRSPAANLSAMSQSASAASHDVELTPHQGGLLSGSFLGVLLAQFLGTINDNVFRWFIVFVGGRTWDDETKALSLGLFCFTLPYLIFVTMAGYLGDRFSKQKVIVYLKLLELPLMLMGVVGILMRNVPFLFFVVALTGCQCALFGPAKFGALPEILRPEKLSAGNGMMGFVTVIGTAMGLVVAGILDDKSRINLADAVSLWQVKSEAIFLVVLAIIGFLCTLLIKPLPPADPHRKLARNPVAETWQNLSQLYRNRPLFLVALGMGYFWLLGSLAQNGVLEFGLNELQLLDKTEVTPLQAMLVLGVAGGSVLAGLWSAGKVELGIVTVGGAGISLSAILMFAVGAPIEPPKPEDIQQTAIRRLDERLAKARDDAERESILKKDREAKAKREGEQPAMSVYREFRTPSAKFAIPFAGACLLLLGFSAGLFNIPLEAFLQHRSDPKIVGVNIAASNFLVFSFILASSGLYYVLREVVGMSSSAVFLSCGLVTLPITVIVFRLVPKETIRCVVWLLFRLVYKVRVFGSEHLPMKGGGLIVANHVSWLDGILLILNSERPIRMIAWADYVTGPFMGWLSRTFGVIPIKSTDGPRAIVTALNTAREAIQQGDLVCIFAEGSLTRTGQLQPFQRGLMRIIDGTDAPVIPTYLDELWGSIFSHRDGKFLWKRPRGWPYRVTIVFGPHLKNPDNVNEVRLAVEKLGVEASIKRRDHELIPVRGFLRKCRAAWSRMKIADSSGQELTGGKTLIGTLAIKRVLERLWLKPDEKNIGILLPPSNGGLLANMAVTISGRVTVNLNYTLTDKDIRYCIAEAGIRHVITSRKFLDKKPVEFDSATQVVFLEDVKEKVTGADKVLSAIAARVVPICILERWLGLTRVQPTDLMTIIFSSGSTGQPKGVMLSHHNIGSNISSADQLFQIKRTDVIVGVLPFFHSFGHTLMMWLPMNVDCAAVYHFNPLDARTVGELTQKYQGTIVAATPTFLKSYLKRCEKEQFATLDLAIVGAEKLPQQLADEFHAKFGVIPTEGYGCTELSPLAAANVPDHRSREITQIGTKLGTVGRAVPNVCAKIVDADTLAELGNNKPGLLLIGGPNVMQGYLNQPEKTASVISDGYWYNTGDIAEIDDDGFIKITGRLSRFSKIGGEMVPHIRIEEELNRIVEVSDSDDAEIKLAVTSVPDEKKGERLIILHKKLSKSMDEILKELGSRELPNLWIPSADSFLEVESIPLLGTGKLDLKAIKDIALKAFGPK
jgi:acyl-[acyl-carrier-protein]-phospholipid O-acyltransferase/long-chain-fatty-acid--[acyl-carrier-protein] ligase